MTPAFAAAGALAVLLAWRLVATRRLSVWAAVVPIEGVVGLVALVAGPTPLSLRAGVGAAAAVGILGGLGLYGATVAFVLAVRRWRVFGRHVADVYDQRRGLPLPAALGLAGGLAATGEELFWRGFFMGRLASVVGWPWAGLATWGAYVGTNVGSGSLPIVAGAVVSGAAWGGLALWTHGVLASILCHSVWTGLMVALPPGRARR